MDFTRRSTLLYLILLLFNALPGLSLRIWDAPADLPSSIPVSCRATLAQDINCGPSFVSARNVVNGLSYDDDFLTQYCSTNCSSSLKTFRTSVAARCRGLEYAFTSHVNMTADRVADALSWAFNVTCIQDKRSSEFCIPKIFNGTAKPCSDCGLKYQAAALQDSEFGNQIVQRDTFESRLSSCGVPTKSYPIPASTSSTSATSSKSPTSTVACYGPRYTAQGGDTCKSVAQANSIGQDIFITQNMLAYNCDSIPAGTELCLGDSCKLHEVQDNETCADITSTLNKVSTWELSHWNPTIHKNCDNIGSMEGRLICISPPGTEWTPDQNSVPGVNNGQGTSTDTFKPYLPTTNMVPIMATPSEPVKQTTKIWGIPTASTRTRTNLQGEASGSA